MRQLSDLIPNRRAPTLEATCSVVEAGEQMRRSGAGAVLVLDGNERLVGIFTARDAVHRVIAAGRDPRVTPLAEVMTAEPTVMAPERSAIEALREMWDGGFRHVPVLDGERVLGVVSRGDFDAGENQRLEDERALWEHLR